MQARYDRLINGGEVLGIVGLGYVGLPLAVAFSKKIRVIAFDINEHKVEQYRKGVDVTGDVGDEALAASSATFTSDPLLLKDASCFIVTVPTPIQSGHVPDLQYVLAASRIVGQNLRKGSVVVYESTVYPGVTEEMCIPVLEEVSGLRCGVDFGVGYSPERVNPGDRVHRLETITKVVSGNDSVCLSFVASLYELIVEAGVHRAESIKVAEAAKVIENAQRDVNIAFMNELAMMFHQMDIDTQDVLRAAETKWNFLKFRPGLVGGHCIGVDPYYLTYKAEESGLRSRIVLTGRHINEGMSSYVVQSLIKTLIKQKADLQHSRVAILGFTFKENCRDIRNTKVADMVRELQEYGIDPLVVDPLADAEEVMAEYGIQLSSSEVLRGLSAVVVAVAHTEYTQIQVEDLDRMFMVGQPKILFDIKGVYKKANWESDGYTYWSL